MSKMLSEKELEMLRHYMAVPGGARPMQIRAKLLDTIDDLAERLVAENGRNEDLVEALLWANRCRQKAEHKLDAQAGRLKQANDTLVRLHDYGIDTRDFGDGDAQALWGRIDEFRADENASLSPDDVRALAEWWAELHESLCDLDEKRVAADEAREKAEAENKRWTEIIAEELGAALEMQEILGVDQSRVEDGVTLEREMLRTAKALVAERKAQGERVTDLEAIVAKLPKTADGVPVVPGEDTVWLCGFIGGGGGVVPLSYAEEYVVSPFGLGSECEMHYVLAQNVSYCYSTRVAALGQKEKPKPPGYVAGPAPSAFPGW